MCCGSENRRGGGVNTAVYTTQLDCVINLTAVQVKAQKVINKKNVIENKFRSKQHRATFGLTFYIFMLLCED